MIIVIIIGSIILINRHDKEYWESEGSTWKKDCSFFGITNVNSFDPVKLESKDQKLVDTSLELLQSIADIFRIKSKASILSTDAFFVFCFELFLLCFHHLYHQQTDHRWTDHPESIFSCTFLSVSSSSSGQSFTFCALSVIRCAFSAQSASGVSARESE